jgi:hypothetical protein
MTEQNNNSSFLGCNTVFCCNGIKAKSVVPDKGKPNIIISYTV